MSEKRAKRLRKLAKVGYALLTEKEKKLYSYSDFLREIKRLKGNK